MAVLHFRGLTVSYGLVMAWGVLEVPMCIAIDPKTRYGGHGRRVSGMIFTCRAGVVFPVIWRPILAALVR